MRHHVADRFQLFVMSREIFHLSSFNFPPNIFLKPFVLIFHLCACLFFFHCLHLTPKYCHGCNYGFIYIIYVQQGYFYSEILSCYITVSCHDACFCFLLHILQNLFPANWHCLLLHIYITWPVSYKITTIVFVNTVLPSRSFRFGLVYSQSHMSCRFFQFFLHFLFASHGKGYATHW